MQMDVGLDTGDMLYKLACPITAEDTSGTLYDKLANLGPRGLSKPLSSLPQVPQNRLYRMKRWLPMRKNSAKKKRISTGLFPLLS